MRSACGELRGGSGEETDAEVAKEAALHGVLGDGGAIKVGAAGFLAQNEALGVHDLEKLEDRGVAEGALAIQLIADFAHRRRFLVPQNAEEFEFRFGGSGYRTGRSRHDERDLIRSSS